MRQRAVRRLHEDPDFLDLNRIEAEATKERLGEQLYMEMIDLRYRDEAELVCGLLDSLKPTPDDVERKPEQVLRLTISADGCILSLIPIPGREVQAWIQALKQKRSLDEVPVNG